MKKYFKQLIFSLPIAVTFSCSNESIESNSSTALNSNEIILVPKTAKISTEQSLRQNNLNDSNSDADEFAKLIASSLKDKEFRKFLKTEANKKFDGDFDILVSKILDASVGNQKFSEKIKNNSPNGYAYGRNIVETAIKNPKLNISVPMLIEKWDDTKQIPLVAMAVGADERTTKQIKAFDSNGKVYLIDAKNEPNLPVIVINNNERMNYQNDKKNNSKSLRTSGNYEKITWLQCPNLSEIESWWYGAPEIRFDGVVYNDNFSAAYQAFSNMEYPNNRNQASNGYTLEIWTQVQNLFIWNFDGNHGPDYYIQAWEIDDDGTTQTFQVNVTAGTKVKDNTVSGGASFNLTYKAQDKRLKGELIHYTHPTPSTIGDGSIQFVLEN